VYKRKMMRKSFLRPRVRILDVDGLASVHVDKECVYRFVRFVKCCSYAKFVPLSVLPFGEARGNIVGICGKEYMQ
jgi:hypothetical protein